MRNCAVLIEIIGYARIKNIISSIMEDNILFLAFKHAAFPFALMA
jgi:hypothetical protein